MKLDKKDIKILTLLQVDSNLTTSQISKKTGIAITTVHNRIKKMQKQEIIKNYTINIDFEKIGKPLKAFILISVNQDSSNKNISQNEVGRKIKRLEGIQEVDIVTGTTDILVKIRAENMPVLNDLITNQLRKIPGVDKTQTMMVLEEI
ncbi:Lrp/AsnC family transcriptional regulator [Candidatus Pacearchaeota archaeon]|jgi:Lrp/AsnC family leucine-responsive transcriptional regulator|nr:Lrp/AsnC family transcriptional regulator [Candidatus Pacearchaeota archaeon]